MGLLISFLFEMLTIVGSVGLKGTDQSRAR